MRETRCSGFGWVKRACALVEGKGIMGAESVLCGSMLMGNLKCSSGRGGMIMLRCVSQSIFRLEEGMSCAFFFPCPLITWLLPN